MIDEAKDKEGMLNILVTPLYFEPIFSSFCSAPLIKAIVYFNSLTIFIVGYMMMIKDILIYLKISNN